MKWIMVEFNCSNGWEKVITSIPESEIETAKEYLEKTGFNDVENIQMDIPVINRNAAFSIANRFYGSDYPLQRSQFDNAAKELGY